MTQTGTYGTTRAGYAHGASLSPRVACLTALLLALPTAAHANGNMGLLLGMFPPPIWAAYVAFSVLFEAIAMARLLHAHLVVALVFSVAANLLTGVCGASVAEVLFHGYGMDPNPLCTTVGLVAGLAPVSGAAEGMIWSLRRWGTAGMQRRPALACIAVHIAAIPLALAVLLAPPRPYAGLEWQANGERVLWVRFRIPEALNRYAREHGRLPAAASYGEALRVLTPYVRPGSRGSGEAWTTEFRAEYHRFNTGEARRVQMWEWNPKASGARVGAGGAHDLWIMRRRGEGYMEGVVLYDGAVGRTTDPSELGY